MGAVYSAQRIGGVPVWGPLFADGAITISPAPLVSASVLGAPSITYYPPGTAPASAKPRYTITARRRRLEIHA
jgi:hypothetical protein